MKVVRRLVVDAFTIAIVLAVTLALFVGTLMALAWIVFTALGLESIGPDD